MTLGRKLIGISAAAVLGAGAALAQFPSPVLPETASRVSDHVQVILGFPNIAIVTGDRATLVVDTGLGPSNGAIAARVAKKLSRGGKLYLTTTHFHPEHAAGEGGFPSDTILLRNAAQQKELIEHQAELLALFNRLNPEYTKLLQGVGNLRTPDVVFENEATVDLGGVTARVMWLGAAHTKGDQLVFVEPDRTLITGDVVQNKVVPGVAGEGGSFASWLTVLDKLELLKPLHVVPDHSRPGDGTLIAAERAFMLDMRSRALAYKKQGLSAADAGKRLADDFKANYPAWAANPDWPNLNSINGFAQRVYAEAN
ncbi:MAG TPA: MBL fold metallo-hydrolase [Bryobacteraceae bacterium]|jgi:glyoxylase-like metal-dependent hydrolase (beta-lactamase superfamily II)